MLQSGSRMTLITVLINFMLILSNPEVLVRKVETIFVISAVLVGEM